MQPGEAIRNWHCHANSCLDVSVCVSGSMQLAYHSCLSQSLARLLLSLSKCLHRSVD